MTTPNDKPKKALRPTGMKYLKASPEETEELKTIIINQRLSRNGVKPWKDIAKSLDLPYTTVRQLGLDALQERSSPEHLQALQGEHGARYNKLMESYWEKAQTDPQAAELVLKIMDKMQNLYGMTVKQVNVNITGDNVQQRAQSVWEKLQATIPEEIIDIPPPKE